MVKNDGKTPVLKSLFNKVADLRKKGLNFLPNYQNGWLDRASIFRGRLLEKKDVIFFSGVAIFT